MTTSDVLERFRNIDERDLARLHTGLEASAARDGILDISYRTIDTPIGALLIAATERGVVRVAF